MTTVSISVAVILALMLSWLVQYTTAVDSVNILTPDSKPYGLTYQEHVINFWKHITSIQSDRNPWQDPTGKNCANEQLATNSSVFYLSGNGGGFSDRTCKVPAGKGLFIPVSPMEISDKEAPNTSVEDLHKIAKKDQDSVTSLYLEIGDKKYTREDLSQYRIIPNDFEVIFPKNAVFGASEGTSKAVADGYYVITGPLAKGNYTVGYKSSLVCLETDCMEPNFVQDIEYKLIVE